MPTATLPEQNGNSCAAHCAVITIVELLGVSYCNSQSYAEDVLWPGIQFVANGDPVIDHLAAEQNTDPRRLLEDIRLRWGGAVSAALLFDDVEKTTALTFVPSPFSTQLGGLFNLIKGTTAAGTIALRPGRYYNCSFAMIKGSAARGGTFEGLHNILVVNTGASIMYYNPNEGVPAWATAPADWKLLEGQNGGAYSYVYAGVCVEVAKR